MQAVAKEAFTEEVRRAIFNHFKLVLGDWQDLGGFESFVFAQTAAKRIFRVTHISHRSLADVEAELGFLFFLKSNDAAVSQPVMAAHGKLVEQVGEFICCQFVMADGQLVTQQDWQSPLFENWGRSIGQFHRLASQYQPIGAKRFDWRVDANLDFRSRIPATESKILELADVHLATLGDFPTNTRCVWVDSFRRPSGQFLLPQ